MRHTPGPWRINGTAIEEDTDDRPVYVLASIYDSEENGEDFADGLANACLIAAAPELYEALEAMEKMTRKTDMMVGIYHPVFTQARAALRKARGE